MSPEKLEPFKIEKRYMTEIHEDRSKFPSYKLTDKKILAWLFVAVIKVNVEPLSLELTHPNEDLLRRFLQLVRLGKIGNILKDIDINTWQLKNPTHISFLMQEIKPHIRMQRERRIADLLISQCNEPNDKTKKKLKAQIIKHNGYFYIQRY